MKTYDIRDVGYMQSTIEEYVVSHKHGYGDYYIGITTSLQNRFCAHNIEIGTNDGLLFMAVSEENAGDVERMFTSNADAAHKMQGNVGGGTGEPGAKYYVYCYLVTPETRQ